MQARERARELVSKIAETTRLGGGFLTYHERAVEELTKIFEEHAAMKIRCDALDELQALTVAKEP